MKKQTLFRPLLIVIASILFFVCCKKKEEKPEENGNNPLPNGGYGCSITNMLNDEGNLQYEFTYGDAEHTLLSHIQQFNTSTGNPVYSYRLGNTYSTEIPGYYLDTIYFYLGDFTNQWYECTIFDYTWITSSTYVIHSAKVYTYAEDYPDNLRPKGNISYEFDDYDLLTGIEYIDVSDEDNGTITDEYRIVYLHDTQERLREMHYYNYNDIETYSEVMTPSSHYQSNALGKLVHPEFGWLSRFAPASVTYYTQGVGTYTYNYSYQTNSQNFVVEQSWTDNDPPVLISLFNWQCN